MADKKDKEYFDSPATKEMRNIAGMNDDGKYENKDYPGRDTKFQTQLKADARQSENARNYINANGNYLRHQAKLNLYRKYSHLRYSKDPLMQQYHKDKVSRANNRLAKEAMKVHQLQKKALPGGLDNPNVEEVVNTMSMATGKPNLGDYPTANLKAGTNVNSDVFKNKWDKNEW